jgi:pimeloyl-ACP methyl ester carboxylesterase
VIKVTSSRFPELSVRSDFSWGTPSRRVQSSGGVLEHTAPRHVILIHGFNVSEKAARESYEEFLDILKAAKWIKDERELGVFWGFHWPGDHPQKLASMAGYSSRVMSARASGDALAKHLNRLNANQKVYIVAHSLGCRVAVETLAAVRDLGDDYSGASIEGVFLMAAAIPSGLCEGSTRPFGVPVARIGEYAYFSRRDRVLRIAFPAGQSFFGEPGHAVGRYGEPTGRWTQTKNTQLGHGEYWSSAQIAEDVGRAFGRRVPRRLPTNSPLHKDVSIVDSQIDIRNLPSRDPGGHLR